MVKYLVPFLLFCSSATAQTVTILETPSGAHVGVLVMPNGDRHFLLPTSITFIRVPKPDPTVPPVTTKVDRVTYVYEKNEGGVPPNVQIALNKLNEDRKILASEFEDDTVDGDGQVPDQYKAALEASKAAGIPCLVVQSGSRVVRVVKITKTMTVNEILEAAK